MMAFILSHWRLTLALLLAGALYTEDSSRRLADSQRDAAVAQEALWKGELDAQSRLVQSLHDASVARDAQAQAAVERAQQAQKADEGRIRALLNAQPKPGEDRCVAARALIWQEVSNANPP